MAKDRPAIPTRIRQQVLKEFNYRCALCGGDGPHLHHIDENPANNDPLNLVPLCPNHHLTDEHDPTRRADPAILRLFRQYRDPAMLKPQFVPLFERFRFLYHVGPDVGVGTLSAEVEDLIRFVQVLAMGDYFAPKVGELLRDPIAKWLAAYAQNPKERGDLPEVSGHASTEHTSRGETHCRAPQIPALVRS